MVQKDKVITVDRQQAMNSPQRRVRRDWFRLGWGCESPKLGMVSHQNNLRAEGNYQRERVNKHKLKLGVDLITAKDCL